MICTTAINKTLQARMEIFGITEPFSLRTPSDISGQISHTGKMYSVTTIRAAAAVLVVLNSDLMPRR